MKKSLILMVGIILIISGNAGTIVNPVFSQRDFPEDERWMEEGITIHFPKLKIEEENGFVSLNFGKNSLYLMEAGKPILPKIVEHIELPFGVRNVEIKLMPKDVEEKEIEGEIAPAPPMLPLGMNFLGEMKDFEVYESDKIFPPSWYEYRVGCGLNSENERVTHVAIHIFPVRYSPINSKIYVMKSAEILIDYEESEINLPENIYDMVIIAPSEFSDELQRLVEHKNNHGIKTFLKTTEEIYENYEGRDYPEKIKYFIKSAIEEYGIKYVLLVGGLKSTLWAKARDNSNEGSKYWYVPVRYTNLYDNPKYPLAESIHDPGVISDLYYADVYKEGGIFESWDTNNDGIFASWNKPGVENDSSLDLYPDVSVGRLACRSIKEVRTMVDKIIRYEEECNPSWFNKITVISGDGFLDQEDLNIQWDTKSLPDGKYTIYAQSINDEGEKGPLDVINITIDRSKKTKLTFNHDDHLNPALKNGYPAPPIAEIVSVSEGDILGNTDYEYSPGENEAYLNTFNPWANISYVDGILVIRGKCYDPKPYGNVTSIHVWIKNEEGETIFSEWRNDTEMYYEGEWTTGEKSLFGRGGALYYMPEKFERNIVWASNGRLTGQNDVINAINEGSGFVFMSGHGSPNVWADHYPGVPGNRQHGSITGLQVTTIKPWFPYIGIPLFPIDTLSNGEKLPVCVIGGCHNSQFNVSAIPAFLNALHLLFRFFPNNYMWTYGQPVPECFSWRLVRNPNGGAIASIGNTGLGYGMPGKECTSGGGDAWITIEFFRQYGYEGKEFLGDAHSHAIVSYINNFDMTDMEAGHTKTVQQWVLLGDPSLKIGGY